MKSEDNILRLVEDKGLEVHHTLTHEVVPHTPVIVVHLKQGLVMYMILVSNQIPLVEEGRLSSYWLKSYNSPGFSK